mmetsp:Transcript_18969/g.28291  ORF Transcript_18969/g.28291 Transcript_18969/m.28291 type:complete len:98 (-) Transcript_18969:37-330(-)
MCQKHPTPKYTSSSVVSAARDRVGVESAAAATPPTMEFWTLERKARRLFGLELLLLYDSVKERSSDDITRKRGRVDDERCIFLLVFGQISELSVSRE